MEERVAHRVWIWALGIAALVLGPLVGTPAVAAPPCDFGNPPPQLGWFVADEGEVSLASVALDWGYPGFFGGCLYALADHQGTMWLQLSLHHVDGVQETRRVEVHVAIAPPVIHSGGVGVGRVHVGEAQADHGTIVDEATQGAAVDLSFVEVGTAGSGINNCDPGICPYPVPHGVNVPGNTGVVIEGRFQDGSLTIWEEGTLRSPDGA